MGEEGLSEPQDMGIFDDGQIHNPRRRVRWRMEIRQGEEASPNGMRHMRTPEPETFVRELISNGPNIHDPSRCAAAGSGSRQPPQTPRPQLRPASPESATPQLRRPGPVS